MKYGTIRYTAPENMTSGKQTLKGEIWSFGCLVLEMATGKKPYSEHCFKSQAEEMIKLSTLNEAPHIPANLPDELKNFLACCFAVNPA